MEIVRLKWVQTGTYEWICKRDSATYILNLIRQFWVLRTIVIDAETVFTLLGGHTIEQVKVKAYQQVISKNERGDRNELRDSDLS